MQKRKISFASDDSLPESNSEESIDTEIEISIDSIENIVSLFLKILRNQIIFVVTEYIKFYYVHFT
jgi:hypothetical protein